MIRTVYIVAYILLSLFFANCESKAVKNEIHKEEIIFNNFKNYKTATLNAKGVESSNYISKSTFRFYDRMIKNALFMDSLNVEKLTLTEKLHVLHIRASLTENKARNMNGKEYFAYLINSEFLDKNAHFNNSLDRVIFKGDSAITTVLTNDKDLGLKLEYLYENNDWKLNIMSPRMQKISELALTSAAKKQGVTGNELIINAIEYRLYIDIENSIWHPLTSKK